jgi:hypothetical protein
LFSRSFLIAGRKPDPLAHPIPDLNRVQAPRDQSKGRETDFAMIGVLRKLDGFRPMAAIGLPWSTARRPS